MGVGGRGANFQVRAGSTLEEHVHRIVKEELAVASFPADRKADRKNIKFVLEAGLET